VASAKNKDRSKARCDWKRFLLGVVHRKSPLSLCNVEALMIWGHL
jgi:hypothetical protein